MAALHSPILSHLLLRWRAPAPGLPAERWSRTLGLPAFYALLAAIVLVVTYGWFLFSDDQQQTLSPWTPLAVIGGGMAFVGGAALARLAWFEFLSDATSHKLWSSRSALFLVVVACGLGNCMAHGAEWVLMPVAPSLVWAWSSVYRAKHRRRALKRLAQTPADLQALLGQHLGQRLESLLVRQRVADHNALLQEAAPTDATACVTELERLARRIETDQRVTDVSRKALQELRTARIAFVKGWRERGLLETAGLRLVGDASQGAEPRWWASLPLAAGVWAWVAMALDQPFFALAIASVGVVSGGIAFLMFALRSTRVGFYRTLYGFLFSLPLIPLTIMVMTRPPEPQF